MAHRERGAQGARGAERSRGSLGFVDVVDFLYVSTFKCVGRSVMAVLCRSVVHLEASCDGVNRRSSLRGYCSRLVSSAGFSVVFVTVFVSLVVSDEGRL